MNVYYCDCYLCGDRFAVFAVLVKVFGLVGLVLWVSASV